MTSEIQTVISLQTYRKQPAHAALDQVETYWNGLRGARLMPDRADVDPRGFTNVLEHVFILERVARGLGRFRLAGTHLNELMGMEVRGMPLTAMILPDSRSAASDALEAVFTEPAVARLSLRAAPGMGRPALNAQILLLPLKSDLGDVTRVLGCLVADGEIGRAPRRFDVTNVSRDSLIGVSGHRAAPMDTPLAHVAAPRPAASSAPHLRLVTAED